MNLHISHRYYTFGYKPWQDSSSYFLISIWMKFTNGKLANNSQEDCRCACPPLLSSPTKDTPKNHSLPPPALASPKLKQVSSGVSYFSLDDWFPNLISFIHGINKYFLSICNEPDTIPGIGLTAVGKYSCASLLIWMIWNCHSYRSSINSLMWFSLMLGRQKYKYNW